jgi:regulator of RNase E activity RraA
MTQQEMNWPEIAERFKKLYVPAVCDVLDEYELRFQFMHHSIRPLDRTLKITGPAFTIVGHSNSTRDQSKRVGPRVIDNFRPHVVAVYETMGDEQTGVWGELWSSGAMRRGCVGAVVDGGIRDTAYIRRVNFPIFHKFTCPGDAVGRFNIVDFECPVSAGGVRINPGDYILGDEDGVIAIPSELTLEVLAKAEALCQKENLIRDAIQTGKPLADLYKEFGKF